MQRSTLKIIGIEEGDETKVKDTESISNKITGENFSNLKNKMLIKVQEAERTPNRLDQKRQSLQHITIKTLNIQIKEKNIESSKGKIPNKK